MGSHALLSPSGASRWLACTPSARFEEKYPDYESDAAREGTQAHKLGEAKIGVAANLISDDYYSVILDHVKESGYYDGSMEEYCEEYKNFVMEKFYEAQARTPDAKLFIEQHLTMEAYVPEGHGTGDIGIIADVELVGIDLKYGKGVRVEAKDNTQLKIYALGFYLKFNFLYDIQKVTMYIYQPRMDNIASFTISVEELLDWAENYLKPRAAMAFKGEGDYIPGKHCGFCKGKHVCKARTDYELEIANYRDKNELSDAEIAEILPRLDGFIKWAKGVQEHALHEATANNRHWAGYKLVEGRSDRTITDEDKCVQLLAEIGVEDVYKPKELKSLTELEKSVGKKRFSELMGNVISKPRGAPTLVPESDKRPVFNSAMLDFEND